MLRDGRAAAGGTLTFRMFENASRFFVLYLIVCFSSRYGNNGNKRHERPGLSWQPQFPNDSQKT
jgi:hypothetical protein